MKTSGLLLAALADIKPRQRKVTGYRQLSALRQALQRELKINVTSGSPARAA